MKRPRDLICCVTSIKPLRDLHTLMCYSLIKMLFHFPYNLKYIVKLKSLKTFDMSICVQPKT